MVDFFDEERASIRDRFESYMNNATDENGDPLFPNQNSPGSPGYTLRELWTRLFQEHFQQLNQMVEDFSPLTARGASLDQWAEFFGMKRNGSQSPSGRALIQSEVTGQTLERLSGSRRITQGTRLEGNTLDLVVAEESEIATNQNSVEVKVESTQDQNGIVASSGMTLDVANREMLTAEITAPVAGGSSVERDDQLRYRLSLGMRAPSTFEGLERTILSDPDVDEVEIEEAAYGPGTASVFVSPAIAYPSEDLRQRLESAASEGPGKVYVTFPSYEGVAFRIRVTSQPSTAEQDVADYINNLSAGDRMIINDVEQVVRDAGAIDAQVIGIRRGTVGEDRSLVQPKTLRQITNLRPQNDRTEWYTRSGWVTICN